MADSGRRLRRLGAAALFIALAACGESPRPKAAAGSAAEPPVKLPKPDQRLCTAVVILLDTSKSMLQEVRGRGGTRRPKSQIALKGSLVPAFGLNSIVSNVPVLGDILASKKGEGIFGVTYSLSGDAEHPAVSANPLSMLTPGILRRIFEGHIPTAANAPSNVQKTQTDTGAADAGTPAEKSATPQ